MPLVWGLKPLFALFLGDIYPFGQGNRPDRANRSKLALFRADFLKFGREAHAGLTAFGTGADPLFRPRPLQVQIEAPQASALDAEADVRDHIAKCRQMTLSVHQERRGPSACL